MVCTDVFICRKRGLSIEVDRQLASLISDEIVQIICAKLINL